MGLRRIYNSAALAPLWRRLKLDDTPGGIYLADTLVPVIDIKTRNIVLENKNLNVGSGAAVLYTVPNNKKAYLHAISKDPTASATYFYATDPSVSKATLLNSTTTSQVTTIFGTPVPMNPGTQITLSQGGVTDTSIDSRCLLEEEDL